MTMADVPAGDRAGTVAGPLVFLVAGEPSGDELGAGLMRGLKELTGGRCRSAGVGGGGMAAEGLASLFPMAELSVMGFAEVVPHLARLARRLRQTVRAVRRSRPDAVVTIDSPGFNFRLAGRLRRLGTPLIHYVAPTVWAWRPRRARQAARLFDQLMALLPFEPPYFEAEGLACTFVGHPVVERGADRGDGAAFRRRHGIPEARTLVCLLPGSRRVEVDRLLPIFAQVAAELAARRPDLGFVLPTVDVMAEEIARRVAAWPVPALVVADPPRRFDAFAAARVALAASGTVALELALAGVPAVIAYKLSPLSAAVARRLVQVRFVNLVNIVLDREAVPEFLQEACRADRLLAAVERLIDDDDASEAQRRDGAEPMRRLGLGADAPSRRAAEVVLAAVARYADGKA